MPIYHPEALTALRASMKKEHIDYYLMTSSDCHASEYVGDYFKVTEFLSGCTSDNVILIVSEQEALLWTDGRYFISAAAELAGTGITLMKDGEKGVPKVEEYLKNALAGGTAKSCAAVETASAHACAAVEAEPANACAADGVKAAENTAKVLAFDGRQVSARQGDAWRKIAEEAGAVCRGDAYLIEDLWPDRPALPQHPIRVLPEEICGKTFAEKVQELRDDLEREGAEAIFLSKLDDIMWLTNLRGNDVLYNPVALSYAWITKDAFVLFVQEEELTEEVRAYAEQYGIRLRPYADAMRFLAEEPLPATVLCDGSASNDAVMQLLRSRTRVIARKNPTEIRKACKNETEMENIRKYYLLDSVALCKFIYYIKKNVGKIPMTELAAARKLDALRAEIPGFLDLSFSTIPAVRGNAAMAHYAPEGDGDPVEPEGFLLVDSGGQYLGATTDVTRTIVLGELTEEMKRDFTLVAVSHFRLMNAVIKQGTGGHMLDMIAREPLYRYGLDYNHGTGHGIGYILNVHEGPQRIGSLRPGAEDVPMMAGMLTSDEPGIYKEGKYGIRTESITLTVPACETEFGSFLKFECLTYVPVDLDAIDPAFMNSEDIAQLNAYHKAVREKIAPHLEGEERDWLLSATREIH